ncbi:hypothetical protein FLAV_01088 [Flavobacteriales bacterium]|nr:hypothetical protein [Flavobacteriales bacterium]CAG0968384.1 hypothetical protein FLAV_01088 [Flavobacteriales bacterium]
MSNIIIRAEINAIERKKNAIYGKNKKRNMKSSLSRISKML